MNNQSVNNLKDDDLKFLIYNDTHVKIPTGTGSGNKCSEENEDDDREVASRVSDRN